MKRGEFKLSIRNQAAGAGMALLLVSAAFPARAQGQQAPKSLKKGPVSVQHKHVTPKPAPSLAPAMSSALGHEPVKGLAILMDGEGKKIGKAIFKETREGVTVAVTVSGLKPGLHGIHIHENGKCEGPDFKSAGAHFNPGQAEHGLKNPQGAHAGDLPNLPVEKDGVAKNAEFRLEGVKLDDGRMGLLKEGGTSIVIHEKEDDQATSPAGNSGDRVACGVIRVRAPKPAASPSPAVAPEKTH